MSGTGAGKGDTPRPLSIPYEQYVANWERIFGSKKKKKKTASKKTDKNK